MIEKDVTKKHAAIKQFLVDADAAKNLFVKLPDEIISNPQKFKAMAEKLRNFTVDDIEIEHSRYVEESNLYVYDVCICDTIRYGLFEQENGDISYKQLNFKNIIG